MLILQKKIFYKILFFWVLLQSVRLVFSQITYDEVVFLQISMSNIENLRNGSLVPNYEGFGSAFWLIYSLISAVISPFDDIVVLGLDSGKTIVSVAVAPIGGVSSACDSTLDGSCPAGGFSPSKLGYQATLPSGGLSLSK
jgi:hypothetical protein